MRQQKKISVMTLFLIMILLQAVLTVREARTVLADETSETSQNILILHGRDGSEYQRITAAEGTAVLPTMAAEEGYTFLGWSSKKGRIRNPQYQVGDSVEVSGTRHLYAVFFDRSTEKDVNVAGKSSGYDQVIFVGDSRTNGMRLALAQEYGVEGIENVNFVAQNGSGLSWLKGTATKQLKSLISQILAKNPNARIAVVFNHGVNNLKHKDGAAVNVSHTAWEYASYLKKLGKTLKKKGCDLYYMSVNPVNSGKHAEEQLRKSTEIRAFNTLMKKKLGGQYTFIDTYSYLMKYGYSTQSLLNATKDDGVHYSAKTYKRIYAYCLKCLRAGSRG